jgi:hypothetical protein
MPNIFLIKNKFFYPIIAIYLFYPLLYIFKDCYGCGYRIINNYDHITNILWMIIGIFAGLVILYSAWQRRHQVSDHWTTAKQILFALLLFFLFYPYMMAITFLDVALFGLRW